MWSNDSSLTELLVLIVIDCKFGAWNCGPRALSLNLEPSIAGTGSVTLCGILLFPGVLQFAGKQTR